MEEDTHGMEEVIHRKLEKKNNWFLFIERTSMWIRFLLT